MEELLKEIREKLSQGTTEYTFTMNGGKAFCCRISERIKLEGPDGRYFYTILKIVDNTLLISQLVEKRPFSILEPADFLRELDNLPIHCVNPNI